MSMNQVSKTWLYQANFPGSQSGLTSEVYYTLYDSSGTIYENKTNSGVVELGIGAYGVNLNFNNEGSYSIHWEIQDTPYIANEEIRIYNFSADVNINIPDVYTGYGS